MDAEKMLAGLVRVGTVMSIDGKRCRVKLDADMTSGWLYVLQHPGAGVTVKPDGEHTHRIRDTYSGGGTADSEPNHNHQGTVTGSWMPKINDTVLVLYIPVEQGDGFVIGVI